MPGAVFGNFIRSSNGADAVSAHIPWTLAPSLLTGITFNFRNEMSRVHVKTQRSTSDHHLPRQVAHFDTQSLLSLPAAQPESITPSPQFTLDSEVIHPPDITSSEQPVNRSQQVHDTLRSSDIVENGLNDDRSRFWAMYQKLAVEYDSEISERYDGDIDTVLMFSGLFSAVSTAFIVTMGPNDSSTTNALLMQIIVLMVKENNGTSIGNIFPLPISPAYPSGQVWFQTLAYASLSFSLLAAFGAVLGKQWLRFYKPERFGRGSLEERGKNRQKKLHGLEACYFDAVLQMCPVLLQISLLLFGISLSSYVWSQQRTISAVIIATTVLGCLLYAITIFASLLSPACPFQTPASIILRMASAFGAFMWAAGVFMRENDPNLHERSMRFRSFIRSIKASTSKLIQRQFNPSTPTTDPTTESAIQWVLATSTEPDKIAAAAAFIPNITWSQDSDIASHCQRLRDTFMDCFENDGVLRPLAEVRAVNCGRALNHLCLASVAIGDGSNTRTASQQLKIWQQWRNIILPRAFEQCKTLAFQLRTSSSQDYKRCLADLRTALRMMVAAAGDGFIHPDNDSIIWRGRFTWDGDNRTSADFHWLVNCLASFSNDHTAAADALLLLSAMPELGNRDQTSTYLELEAVISAMKSDNPSRLHYAALRVVSESRMALAGINNVIEDEKIRESLLAKLSSALLAAVICPDGKFNYWRDDAYLRLIMVLAANEQWCRRLVADRHIEHCILLLNNPDEGCSSFLLAAVFGQVCASCPDAAKPEAVAVTQFASLAKLAWQSVFDLKLYDESDCVSALPAVVNFTEYWEKDIPTADLKDIHKNVGLAIDKLKRRNEHPQAMSAMQNYYNTLTRLTR